MKKDLLLKHNFKVKKNLKLKWNLKLISRRRKKKTHHQYVKSVKKPIGQVRKDMKLNKRRNF